MWSKANKTELKKLPATFIVMGEVSWLRRELASWRKIYLLLSNLKEIGSIKFEGKNGTQTLHICPYNSH